MDVVVPSDPLGLAKMSGGDGDDDGDGKKPPDNYSDLAEFDIQTNKTEECRLLHGSTTGSLEYLCINIHTVSIGAMLLVCNCILISLLRILPRTKSA